MLGTFLPADSISLPHSAWQNGWRQDRLQNEVFTNTTKRSSKETFLQKRLSSYAKFLYNPSDPLHAYPNNVDLIVHNLFQRAATFEINNADSVRTILTIAQDLGRAGLVLGTVAGIVAISVAVPLANAGRRSSVDDEENIDWNEIDRLTKTVVSGINEGHLQYQV